jgi:NADH-quinone oxidoreductase subunit N
MRPHVDWFALTPVLVLLGASSVSLFAAVLVPRGLRRPLAALVCALGFAGAFVAATWLFVESPDAHGVIADALRRDRWAELASIVVAGAGLLVVGVSYSERQRDDHIAEFYALLAAAGAGMVFFVGANNLMTIFLSLEWFSLSLYALCAVDYELPWALEAGLKYLVVGSFGSAILLFGSALTYGATGQLALEKIGAAGGTHDVLYVVGLAMIITGLGFKSSSAPFHMWTPDVYEGAATPVTAFMAAATKTVALVVMLRVLVTAFPAEARLWTWTIAGIAVASLVVGNLAALVQRSVKRLLAYSSISHAGFILIGVASNNPLGARAVLWYLIPYSAMSVGAFAVVAARERELNASVTLDNLAGFGWERPLLGAALAVFMFGFAGMPLTGGFVGKFYVFAAARDHGFTWLIIVGVIATAVSLYYYLGVIRAMFMRPSAELQLTPTVVGGSPPAERLLQASVVACLLVTIGSFFAVQPLIELARDAAASLPF